MTDSTNSKKDKVRKQQKQMMIWLSAMVIGVVIGAFGISWIDASMNFIASIYTRLFQLLAVPTIVLAIITTMAQLGAHSDSGRIFGVTIKYTILTTVAAAAVGLLLYLVVEPGNLPKEAIMGAAESIDTTQAEQFTFVGHLLSVVPNNMVKPFLEGNVLSLLLIAFLIGFALANMKVSEGTEALKKFFSGLQEMLFFLIGKLIWSLPLGIIAFAAQLSAQMTAGMAAESLGKYVLVVMGGNVIQFFIILPLFLLAKGINPIRHLSNMMPAVLMALFTKSSAATIPVTIESAEKRANIMPNVARFVVPICTTINMNGCATFILVTSLFVMQNGDMPLDLPTMLMWLVISVLSAIGNAGVPMGCFFLTMSLMTGVGAPVGVLGIILPIYAVIDMIETAENVWSDSCVAAMTNKDAKKYL